MPEPTAAQFRLVMAHVPTSVAIVAGLDDGSPRGLSVGTFVPVSLQPALVGFFVARTSTSWPPIGRSGSFCVSVLGDQQASLSSRFALSDIDKFAGVDWRPGPYGNPVLLGAVAWVDCLVDKQVETGDHMLVLGRVRDMGVETGGAPLLHHRSAYGRMADRADEDPLLD